MTNPQSDVATRPILFANTGVQIVCIPLPREFHFSGDQAGTGWQHCRCKIDDEVVKFGYIQWQLLPRRLFLALDTTMGDDSVVADQYQIFEVGIRWGQHIEQRLDVCGHAVRCCRVA